MKSLLRITFYIILIVICGLSLSLSTNNQFLGHYVFGTGATWYVDCGVSAGDHSGSSFTNAMSDLPGTLSRGDNYSVAGRTTCTYAIHTYGDDDSNGLNITIRHANSAQDSGILGFGSLPDQNITAVTFQDALKPDPSTGSSVIANITAGHYIWEGVWCNTDPASLGIANKPSCGIRIVSPNPNKSGNGVINVGNPSGLSNLTFSHVEYGGIGKMPFYGQASTCSNASNVMTLHTADGSNYPIITGDKIDAWTSGAVILLTGLVTSNVSGNTLTVNTGAPSTITAVSYNTTSGILTVTTTNSFLNSEAVVLTGLTTNTSLNGTSATISTATGSQFTASIGTGKTITNGAETGTVTAKDYCAAGLAYASWSGFTAYGFRTAPAGGTQMFSNILFSYSYFHDGSEGVRFDNCINCIIDHSYYENNRSTPPQHGSIIQIGEGQNSIISGPVYVTHTFINNANGTGVVEHLGQATGCRVGCGTINGLYIIGNVFTCTSSNGQMCGAGHYSSGDNAGETCVQNSYFIHNTVAALDSIDKPTVGGPSWTAACSTGNTSQNNVFYNLNYNIEFATTKDYNTMINSTIRNSYVKKAHDFWTTSGTANPFVNSENLDFRLLSDTTPSGCVLGTNCFSDGLSTLASLDPIDTYGTTRGGGNGYTRGAFQKFGAAATYSLSITKSGTGTGTVTESANINCGATCSHTYNAGSVITLTAGSAVTWSGACTGTNLTCTFTLNSPSTVNAKFNAVVGVTLTVDNQTVVAGQPLRFTHSGTNCSTGLFWDANGFPLLNWPSTGTQTSGTYIYAPSRTDNFFYACQSGLTSNQTNTNVTVLPLINAVGNASVVGGPQ